MFLMTLVYCRQSDISTFWTRCKVLGCSNKRSQFTHPWFPVFDPTSSCVSRLIGMYLFVLSSHCIFIGKLSKRWICRSSSQNASCWSSGEWHGFIWISGCYVLMQVHSTCIGMAIFEFLPASGLSIRQVVYVHVRLSSSAIIATLRSWSS